MKMTLTEAKGKFGRCTKCHEMTEISEPCCNAGVEFEGSIYFGEDFDDDSDVHEPIDDKEHDEFESCILN